MGEIKNIIFDLGGVIINLDIPKTIAEFNKLTHRPFEAIYTQLQQTPLFDDFDKGRITEEKFFEEIKRLLEAPVTNEQLRHAWNAMLLDFPLHRLELLKTLKTKYRLFLLSNTNETHITEFEKQLQLTRGHKNLEPFFEKVYYSCRINMRKPDTEIFELVLNENNLKPRETLFLDDSPQHIEGALKTGIRAHFLVKEKEFGALLKELHLME
jgi:epoxide hydrolase-like predicted phosphatase